MAEDGKAEHVNLDPSVGLGKEIDIVGPAALAAQAESVELDLSVGLGPVFDPVEHETKTARYLAYGLLYVFLASVGVVVSMAFYADISDASELAKIILPVTGGPLAVALGYYFGASK